jgi:hypothetical protein
LPGFQFSPQQKFTIWERRRLGDKGKEKKNYNFLDVAVKKTPLTGVVIMNGQNGQNTTRNEKRALCFLHFLYNNFRRT